MTSVEVSPVSVAGLSVICLTVPELAAPLRIRVVETGTAEIVERLAARVCARAHTRNQRPSLDLDELIARAEIITMDGPAS